MAGGTRGDRGGFAPDRDAMCGGLANLTNSRPRHHSSECALVVGYGESGVRMSGPDEQGLVEIARQVIRPAEQAAQAWRDWRHRDVEDDMEALSYSL